MAWRAGTIQAVTLNESDPITLGDAQGYRFSMAFEYLVAARTRRDWAVEIVSYEYVVYNADDQELLIYHWHPEWAGQIAFPHLHLESRLLSDEQRRTIAHKHLPSGHIALEDVIRMLIEELGVEPRRRDWAQVLEATEGQGASARTWATRRKPR